MASRAAPAVEVPEDGLLVFVVEHEVDPGEWQPAGWFREFPVAMQLACAFERARVRLVAL
jgi:hypothetical protein